LTEENVKSTESQAAEEPIKKAVTQPVLDQIVTRISESVGSDAIEDAYINALSDDIPTVVIKNEHWFATARILKQAPELSMNYLRNITGVDQEKHLEAVYHFTNIETKQECCIKVKTDRENSRIASITPLWPTADWQEREIFDLLGIEFIGHPNLKRIMMSDDWSGHPLRKDYEPLDPEV